MSWFCATRGAVTCWSELSDENTQRLTGRTARALCAIEHPADATIADESAASRTYRKAAHLPRRGSPPRRSDTGTAPQRRAPMLTHVHVEVCWIVRHSTRTLGIQSKSSTASVTVVDRPEKANAYDRAHLVALRDAIATLRASTSVVIISSTSDASSVREPIRRDEAGYAGGCEKSPGPGRLHGACACTLREHGGRTHRRGGCSWHLPPTCVSSGMARAFVSPRLAGDRPAAGGCTRLTGLLGAAVAKQVILGGQDITAVQAVDWDWVEAAACARWRQPSVDSQYP